MALAYLYPGMPRRFRKPKTGIEIGRNGNRKKAVVIL